MKEQTAGIQSETLSPVEKAESRASRAGVLAAAGVFFLLLFAYFLTQGGEFFISDGEVMYQTTVAVVDRHSVELQPNPGLLQIVPGRDGKYFSKYGIGQPLLATVPYMAAKVLHRVAFSAMWRPALQHYLVTLMNLAITALTGALIFLIAHRLGSGPRLSIGLALAWGLGTIAWPYSKTFFSEPLFTFLLVLAALGLLAYRQAEGLPLRYTQGRLSSAEALSGPKGKGPPSVLSGEKEAKGTGRFTWLAVAGLALGYAILTRISGAVLLPAFLAYAVWGSLGHPEGSPFLAVWAHLRRSGGRAIPPASRWLPQALAALAAFGLPFAVCVVVLMWHNVVRFGSPFDNGYTEEAFITPLLTGLSGLLLSPGKSIFLYVPLAALAVVAWPWFLRRRPAEALLYGAITIITLAQFATWWAWWGGWCWGPRFLVPTLPFVILSLGPLLQRSRAARLAAWPLFFAGLAVALLGALVDFNPYLEKTVPLVSEPDLYLRPEHSPLLAHARFLLDGQHLSVATFDMQRLGFGAWRAQALLLLLPGMLALALTLLWRSRVLLRGEE